MVYILCLNGLEQNNYKCGPRALSHKKLHVKQFCWAHEGTFKLLWDKGSQGLGDARAANMVVISEWQLENETKKAH